MERQNHRKFTRFPLNALVWWSQDWEPEPLALVNISAGGMLCEFSREVEAGEKVNIEVALPQEEAMHYCQCRVVHCRPEGTQFLVGLEFVEMEGIRQEDLIKHLEQYLGQCDSPQEKPSG